MFTGVQFTHFIQANPALAVFLTIVLPIAWAIIIPIITSILVAISSVVLIITHISPFDYL